MTRFTFIRHGETDLNARGCLQGQVDVPLNARGHAQAQRLVAALAATPADAFYSSDLLRARQTAAPLEAAWGRPAVLLPALREQAYGIVDGLDLPTVQARFPGVWQEWLARQADYPLPGGESGRAFQARVQAAVQALADAHGDAHVVVVTHGGVLDLLWRQARRLGLDGPREAPMPHGGVNRLHWRDGQPHIDTWAEEAHLRNPRHVEPP